MLTGIRQVIVSGLVIDGKIYMTTGGILLETALIALE